jgi:thioredoxin-dependent peroxiredoxin
MLAIGSKAPDFKLILDTGKVFRLRTMCNKRNVIISFFPDGNIDAETEETNIFLQNLQNAQSLGAVIIAISPKNIDELRKMLDMHHMKLLIASDPTLEVCRNYHAFWLRGLGLRKITYVIDKNGIIRGRLSHHLITEKSWEPITRLLHDLRSPQKKKVKKRSS